MFFYYLDGFCTFGEYEKLTDAIDADFENANWKDIDFSSEISIQGMKHGCADENCTDFTYTVEQK